LYEILLQELKEQVSPVYISITFNSVFGMAVRKGTRIQKRKSQAAVGNCTMDRLDLFIGNYICIQEAKQLADSALKLLDSSDGNDHTNALGLYTLAIEEFGKAVILKEECLVDDDGVTQKVPKNQYLLT
jgi:hypothetical protein